MLNDKFVSSANQILADMQKMPTLQKGLELSKLILTQISASAKNLDLSDVKDRCVVDVVGIGNTKMESWFKPHPYLGGHLSAFDLYVNQKNNLEAKFYHLNEKITKRIVAGSVQLLPNWEDNALLTRNSDWKVGIDFFLSSDCKSLLFVLSLEGNLRILEFTERITNTQAQIIEKLSGAGELDTHEAIHTVLWNALSIREVNKEFYAGVSELFEELRSFLIKNKKNEEDAKIFSSRLMGRLLFLWFLRRKKIITDESYFDSTKISSTEYYDALLKPLFFDVLANPVEERTTNNDISTPYLNGGLFEIHDNDWAKEKIKFPTGFFDRTYSHFGKFNFTTDESSPDYEQVAIDPEMLGRVFESLLATQLTESGDSARKAMGAYYTPREVVTFMCRESVRQYLYKQIDNPSWNSGINRLIDASDANVAKAHSNFLRDLWGSENAKVVIPKILKAIYDIQVIDPACGSGAFPLGMVQTLQRLVERLDPKAKPHEIKIRIIQNCVFGVDIEPMAIEIAKLRTWLALAVDVEDVEIMDPLPNLDFKFICANSLVPLADMHDGLDFGNDPELEKNLSETRSQYFKTNSRTEKYRLRDRYYKLTKRDFSTDTDLRSRQLRSFDPFGFSNAAEFFDAEQMFGLSRFDVVIGNPPYVRYQRIKYKKDLQRYRIYSGTSDLFTYFFEMALNNLKPGGVLSYITSAKYGRALYGENLRNLLANETEINYLVDYGNEHVFAAITNTWIIQCTNKMPNSKNEFTISESINGDRRAFQQAKLNKHEWSFGEQSDDNLRKKIESVGSRVIDSYQVFYGLITGLNEAFVIDKEERDKLIALDKKNKEIIKPLLRGRDIGKYEMKPITNWLIATRNEFRVSDRYPSLAKYLEKRNKELGGKISARGAKGTHWMNLRDCAYYDQIESPKVIWLELTDRSKFTYSSKGEYMLNGTYIMTGKNLFYILGILNSKLINYYFKFVSNSSGMGTTQWRKYAVEQFPIRKYSECDEKLRSKLENLVKRRLDLPNSVDAKTIIEIEEEIDNVVFAIYQLTSDEIEIINEATK